jgi:tripartite ATP-independent transporter DctP family solute receptor
MMNLKEFSEEEKMLRRSVCCLILLLVVVCTLNHSIFGAESEYVLRFTTTSAPDAPAAKAMYKFADTVKTLSNGKIEVKVYHSGQLGDQKAGLLGVMRGTIEMSGDGGPSSLADIGGMPKLGVLSAAFIFRDVDHMYQVMNGPLVKKYQDELAQKSGIRVLDNWYLGTRQLNLVKKVGIVRTPQDLKGVKLRMPNSQAFMDMGRALGANPTPLGLGDVYMALRTGTIEGQDNPLPGDLAMKFVEVTKYIVLTDHSITCVNPTINEKLWKSMPGEYKIYIRKALEVARTYNNNLVLEEEAVLLGKFKSEYGMEVITPDKKAFMQYAKKYYSDKRFNQLWGKGMYAKIQDSKY